MKEISRELLINGDCLVKDIQQQFNLLYPYLKIEFCKKTGGTIPNIKYITVSPLSKINELTSLEASTEMSIENTRTVAEIAADFKSRLGLEVRLFRKSGNIWNAISLTGGWSLESQNKAGEFISTEMATVNK